MNTLILVLLAGIMNGSFVAPLRSIQGLTSERIWFHYSWIAMTILPLLAALFLTPVSLQTYLLLPSRDFAYLILGGCVFGMGQVCLAYAIDHLGIAQSFVINLSISLILGSLGTLFQLEQTPFLFSKQGLALILAFGMVLYSLVSNYFLEKKQNLQTYSHYARGWLLAIVAGVASALQNITFTAVTIDGQWLFPGRNVFWAWPPFLVTATFPMLLGFWYRSRKNSLAEPLKRKDSAVPWLPNGFRLVCMGLLFTGSLVLYSQGLSQLQPEQRLAGWPTFMVSIIITSQVWGWIQQGSKNKETMQGKEMRIRVLNLILLIVAVFMFATEMRENPHKTAEQHTLHTSSRGLTGGGLPCTQGRPSSRTLESPHWNSIKLHTELTILSSNLQAVRS